MSFWKLITPLGDAGLLIPAAIAVGFCLYAAGARRATVLWFGLLGCAGLLVAATKIAFIGWGLGIYRFNYTGISGHSMLSMAVIPVALLLIAGDTPLNRRIILPIGAVIALLIAISRVKIHVHSPFEVLAGNLTGAAAAGFFLWQVETPMKRITNIPVLSVSLVFIVLAGYGHAAPTQDLITRIAVFLSGRDHPYTRTEWWKDLERREHPDWFVPQGAFAKPRGPGL